MSCTDSQLTGNSKAYNMGEVLGKLEETEKPEEVREDADGATTPSSQSDTESDLKDEDGFMDLEEDVSWLLPQGVEETEENKCSCEGCLKRLEIHKSEIKNATMMLEAWKEFREFMRNVYANSYLEPGQPAPTLTASAEENPRAYELAQVLRLCDSHQLFEKIEDEVRLLVLESQAKQLKLLEDNSKQGAPLAEMFITGLIEEYAKILSAALYLSPLLEVLLGQFMQSFGLKFEMLNKQLYQSLVYNHPSVQNSLPSFISQLRSLIPFKDNHELVHLYLAFDDEMAVIGSVWKEVEPLIVEHRVLHLKQKEAQLKLQDALKAYLKHKNAHMSNEEATSSTDDPTQYCPKCMTKLACPCDECAVMHMVSCRDLEPLSSKSSSTSSPPSEPRKEAEGADDNCECHACTAPVGDLNLDCCLPLQGTHGEGFQLYPHIHGNITDINFLNVEDAEPLKQLEQQSPLSPVKTVPEPTVSRFQQPTNQKKQPLNLPKDMPPLKTALSLTPEQLATIKKNVQQRREEFKEKKVTETKIISKSTNTTSCKVTTSGNNIQSGVCGTCSKHGNGFVKNHNCSKNSEKHLAAIARLGLSASSTPRNLLRCASGKDSDHNHPHSHSHKSKYHTCEKQSEGDKKECDVMECDDSSSQDETCSERSNSTSTSTQKENKHCDCCYCEVFGHGLPTVAPVSRNYHEMRDRLRTRLNMKKKASCSKQQQPLPQQAAASQKPPGAPTIKPDDKVADVPKEEDLDKLLKYIEGSLKDKCLDSKKIEKRARQKQKKIEEQRKIEEQKRREEEEAAKKKQLERQLALAKRSQNSKEKGKGRNGKNQGNKTGKQVTVSAKVKQTGEIQTRNENENMAQALKLMGLRSLTEQRDNNTPPKMVTIKRVLEPNASEPTVTITLKGSTPDKDKVLFTLKNGSGKEYNGRQQVEDDDEEEEEEEYEDDNTKKSKKTQKKERQRQKKLEAKAQLEEQLRKIEEELANDANSKKKKKKNKQIESQHSTANGTATQADAFKQNKTLNNALETKINKKTQDKSKQTIIITQQKNIPTKQPETKKQKTKPTPSLPPQRSQVKTALFSPPPESMRVKKPDIITIRKSDTVHNDVTIDAPSYRLSEVLHSIAPSPPPSAKEEITLENLKLPPGITITKIENPTKRVIKPSDNPGKVTRPTQPAPPIIVSPRNPVSTPSGNVILVDTHRLKEVMQAENQNQTSESKKKKKKKNKNKTDDETTTHTIEVNKIPPGPKNFDGQHATIIKTSDNMVTIRSPALQQAMEMQQAAYSNMNGMSVKSRVPNGYVYDEVEVINKGVSGMGLGGESLAEQMRNLNIQEGSRASKIFAMAVAASNEGEGKKKKKKKKNGGKVEKEMDAVDSVFQPKDIDLDNGDIDDDERELEAFKRFCLQSVPSERKDKVKVNLNIKDIVLKKKSSAIGCS